MIVACLLIAGCGSPQVDDPSDAGGGTDPNAAPTTEPAPASTEPVPTVRSTASSPETGTAGPTSPAEVEALIPIVEVRTGPRESPAPYFGQQDQSGGAAAAADGFSPATGDEQFCWAVEVINRRPQPIDELEEVVVAGEYFRAIDRFAPPDAIPHLRALIEFTTTIAAQGSFTEADEFDGDHPVAAAFASMNTLVDQRCLGLA